MSIAISHNMDKVNEITQTDLDKYFGLDPTTNKDASGSKEMKVAGGSTITYTYTRGGVTLTGTVNYASQETTWTVTGGGIVADDNRHKALAEGLKIPEASLTVT